MNVTRIYVNTYKGDLHWCYLCLASIRHWYPDIEIVLIKDLNKGVFDTRIIERVFNVSLFETNETFGWGYGKLEPLFLKNKESFLVLDSDTVIVGDVLADIEGLNADFIVDDELQPESRFNEIYFEKGQIKNVLKTFEPLDFSFNSGQWFGTSGIISRSEFDSTIEWNSPRQNKFPQIIKNGEQGHINFHFQRLLQEKKIEIKRKKIMRYPLDKKNYSFNLKSIKKKNSQDKVIVHWAGIKGTLLTFPDKSLIFFFLFQLIKKVGLFETIKLLIKFIFPR